MLRVLTIIKRVAYLFMVAWMLGVSNVILEETRMVHDNRAVIEQQEEVPDTDFESKDLIL